MTWRLVLDETSRFEIAAPSDLETWIRALASEKRESPQIIHLIAPDNATLSIGLGGDKAILNYVPPNGWPAQTSVGDPEAVGILAFTVAGELSELQARHAIPFDVALHAALHFFATQQLSPLVAWEAD